MHKTNTVDCAVVYEGEIWLELDDVKTTQSGRRRRAKRYAPRVAKQRHEACHDVVLSEWREGVTPIRCRNDLRRQFQIFAAGIAFSFFILSDYSPANLPSDANQTTGPTGEKQTTQ